MGDLVEPVEGAAFIAGALTGSLDERDADIVDGDGVLMESPSCPLGRNHFAATLRTTRDRFDRRAPQLSDVPKAPPASHPRPGRQPRSVEPFKLVLGPTARGAGGVEVPNLPGEEKAM